MFPRYISPFLQFASFHDRGAQVHQRSRVDAKDATRLRGHGARLGRDDASRRAGSLWIIRRKRIAVVLDVASATLCYILDIHTLNALFYRRLGHSRPRAFCRDLVGYFQKSGLGKNRMSERALLFDVQLRLMVPEDLAGAIRDAAVREQTTLSEYCRAAIKQQLRRDRRKETEEAA